MRPDKPILQRGISIAYVEERGKPPIYLYLETMSDFKEFEGFKTTTYDDLVHILNLRKQPIINASAGDNQRVDITSSETHSTVLTLYHGDSPDCISLLTEEDDGKVTGVIINPEQTIWIPKAKKKDVQEVRVSHILEKNSSWVVTLYPY